MGFDKPASAITRNGAAVAPRPPSSVELVGDDFVVFHWRHDARISNPVQQSVTVIEIRPFKGGWQSIRIARRLECPRDNKEPAGRIAGPAGSNLPFPLFGLSFTNRGNARNQIVPSLAFLRQ